MIRLGKKVLGPLPEGIIGRLLGPFWFMMLPIGIVFRVWGIG